jgi:hypothetical protein
VLRKLDRRHMKESLRLLNPFANGVLTQFNVPSRLRSHVVGPLDAGFIVIVNMGRLINMESRKTRITNILKNIT